MKFFKRLGNIAQSIGRGIGDVSGIVNKILPVLTPMLGMVPQGRALLTGAGALSGLGQGIGQISR